MTKQQAAEFLKSDDVYKAIFNNIPLHVVITDTDAVVVDANKEVERITGYSREEIIGQNPRLWGGLMPASFYQEFWDVIKNQKKTYVGVIKNKKKNGKEYFAALKVSPILDDDKTLLGFCGIEQDITEIQALSDSFDIKDRYSKILERSEKFLK